MERSRRAGVLRALDRDGRPFAEGLEGHARIGRALRDTIHGTISSVDAVTAVAAQQHRARAVDQHQQARPHPNAVGLDGDRAQNRQEQCDHRAEAAQRHRQRALVGAAGAINLETEQHHGHHEERDSSCNEQAAEVAREGERLGRAHFPPLRRMMCSACT